jgi:chitinase
MHAWIRLLIAATLVLGSRSVELEQPPHPQAARDGVQIIGYFSEDGVDDYTVRSVAKSGAAALLTQLNYAFGRVANNRCAVADRGVALEHEYKAAESVDGTDDPSGDKQLRGTFHQLLELKRQYPHLKIVISLGGWGQSQGFSSAAAPANLRRFVRSCVDMFLQGHLGPGIEAPGLFDGIDLDWEYPVHGGVSGGGRPEDKANFTALAAEFRRQMDAIRPGLILSAAVPAMAELYGNFDFRQLSTYLNELGVMAYDMHWNTEPITNLQSALFHDSADPSLPPFDKHYTDWAVRALIDAGVPVEKLILGVPFYGRGWAGVRDTNHGLYQRASGPAREAGFGELKVMRGADLQFYPALATCSIWQNSSFWSFDCPDAMREKMEYVRRNRLAGVMVWELRQDTKDGELLRVLTGH